MEPIRLELPTGLDVGPVNAYLFCQPEAVLVDAGVKSAESWAALESGLAEHGLTVGDLSRVIITHPHIDHFGQAGTIVAYSDADVWICDLGAPWLVDTAVMWQKRAAYYREDFLPHVGYEPALIEVVIQGMAAVGSLGDPVPSERVHTFAANGRLQMGGLAWQVIHTPGHASAQTCFYQPETRQLLSADQLLATTPTPVVERPLASPQRLPALPQFMQSLRRIAALDVEAVYPGHGRPFGSRFGLDHQKIIRRQCDRIQTRKAECLEHVRNGRHTPLDLLEAMYAHHPPQLRFAGLWMLIGYLDLLLEENAIRQETINGVWHFLIDD
jgi:glyoxylase-like metal-dependent hydrolase (beta-lactamase superfamily II)